MDTSIYCLAGKLQQSGGFPLDATASSHHGSWTHAEHRQEAKWLRAVKHSGDCVCSASWSTIRGSSPVSPLDPKQKQSIGWDEVGTTCTRHGSRDCMNQQLTQTRRYSPQKCERRKNKAIKWTDDGTRSAKESLWQDISLGLGPGGPFRPGARQDGQRSSGRSGVIVMLFPSLREVRGKHSHCPEIQHIGAWKQFSDKM